MNLASLRVLLLPPTALRGCVVSNPYQYNQLSCTPAVPDLSSNQASVYSVRWIPVLWLAYITDILAADIQPY